MFQSKRIIYNILLSLHNILRWIILLLLLVNIIRHAGAIKKPFSNTDKQLGLWLMIAAHITLLVGLYQWFVGGLGLQNIKTNGIKPVMQNGMYRFFAVEHAVGMIIAIIIITVARGVFRKNISDNKKHKRCLTLYVLALLIILAFIPWPGMENIGRPLLRSI